MPPKKAVIATEKTTPATKPTARKTTSRAKTTTTKAASTAKTQVEANARHIEENTATIKNNSSMIHVLYGAIILLMLIIAGLAFYVGQMMGNQGTTTPSVSPVITAEEITITVIDDARCVDCQAGAIMEQLQVLPFLAGATFVEQDFSDSGVSDYIIENNITALPVVIFNSNAMNDGGQITPYLTALPDGQFSLALGATFDPFATRSEKGFLEASSNTISEIQESAHYVGNADALLTWVEYTDVNCHYCQQMESDGTAEAVLAIFPNELNKTSSHYIGVGGAASQTAAEILECVARENGADMYNEMLSETLLSKSNSESTLYALAEDKGADREAIESCYTNGETSDLVAAKFALGRDTFGITGTPGNVIINNQTGEYEIISGAYPASAFEEVINKMLAE